MNNATLIAALVAVVSMLLCATGCTADQLSVDWGPREWGGGYITITTTNDATVCFGLREDGMVVWRKQ
jgi:hypothetical protein